MKIEKYFLPSHWAVPLAYGDESGLSEQDEQELSYWLRDNPGLYLLDVSKDEEFMHFHDAPKVLPCSCLEFIFEKIEG